MTKKENNKKIKVRLKRSLIGIDKRQRAVAKGLGLSKINDVKVYEYNQSIRGMINKILYLLELEEC